MDYVWVIYYDGTTYQQVIKEMPAAEADKMDPTTYELDAESTIIAVLLNVTDGQALVIGEETSYFSTGD